MRLDDHNEGKLPTLRALLARRGVEPSGQFGDYQAYIERKSKSLKAGKLSNGTASGSVHVALGRLIDPGKP